MRDFEHEIYAPTDAALEAMSWIDDNIKEDNWAAKVVGQFVLLAFKKPEDAVLTMLTFGESFAEA